MLKLFECSMVQWSYHPRVNVRWKEEMDGLINFIHFHSGKCGNVCCHCFPDDAEVVSMLHLHIRQGNEIESHTTFKEMDTKWVKSGFTSFLTILNHVVLSKGHHDVPNLRLNPLYRDLYSYISSPPPSTSYWPWRC